MPWKISEIEIEPDKSVPHRGIVTSRRLSGWPISFQYNNRELIITCRSIVRTTDIIHIADVVQGYLATQSVFPRRAKHYEGTRLIREFTWNEERGTYGDGYK